MFQGPYTGFKSVIDLRSLRAPLAALGFYAFHVAACVVVSSLISGVLGITLVITGMDYHSDAFVGATMRAAEFSADTYATLLYALIIQTRGKWKNPLSLLGLLATLLLAAFGGALLGIIPAGVTLAAKPGPATKP